MIWHKPSLLHPSDGTWNFIIINTLLNKLSQKQQTAMKYFIIKEPSHDLFDFLRLFKLKKKDQ
jgi:hypothetical protein